MPLDFEALSTEATPEISAQEQNPTAAESALGCSILLQELTEVLCRRDADARKLILRSCPDRIHTILPGLLLMDAVCAALCEKEIYVSRYGVREGYLCRRILENGI